MPGRATEMESLHSNNLVPLIHAMGWTQQHPLVEVSASSGLISVKFVPPLWECENRTGKTLKWLVVGPFIRMRC